MAYGFLLLDMITTATPDRMLSNSAKYGVLSAKFGDGYEQRSPRGINSLQLEFQISFVNRSETEIQAITDFLDSKEAVTAFDFTYPSGTGETTIKVICESYNVTYKTSDIFSCNASFRRVYTL